MSNLAPVDEMTETSASSTGSDESSEISIDSNGATVPELVIDVDDVDTIDDSGSTDDSSTAGGASVYGAELANIGDTAARNVTISGSNKVSDEVHSAEDGEADGNEAVVNANAADTTSVTKVSSHDGSTEDSENLNDTSTSQTDSDVEQRTTSACFHESKATPDSAPDGETPENKIRTDKHEVLIVSFHADAEDLYLEVQEDSGKHVLYHVLAANFASASPTWRQIIYGGNYPRPETGKWTIKMLNDDSYGLGVLLSVVHYQFGRIPERPTIDEMYRIALIADKYKCVHLLRPYFKAWLDNLNRQLVLTDSHTAEDNKVLFITWAVGDLRWFPKILHHVIGQATISPDGSLLDSQSQKWDTSPLPHQIIGKSSTHLFTEVLKTLIMRLLPLTDQIKHVRLQKIDQVLSAVKTPVENLLHCVNTGGDAYCRVHAAEEKRKCEHAQLGSLVQGLCIAGLYPFELSQPYTGSVENLAKTIMSVKLTKMSAQGIKPHQDPHSGCSPGYKMLITTYQAKLPDLTAYALLHLTKQAKASGVYGSLMTYFDKPEVKDRLVDGHTGVLLADLDDLELREKLLEKTQKSTPSPPQEDACHTNSEAGSVTGV
jgi:hypothetical protein